MKKNCLFMNLKVINLTDYKSSLVQHTAMMSVVYFALQSLCTSLNLKNPTFNNYSNIYCDEDGPRNEVHNNNYDKHILIIISACIAKAQNIFMVITKKHTTYHQNVSSPTYRHPQVHNPLIPNNPCDQLKNFHNSSGPLVDKRQCVL